MDSIDLKLLVFLQERGDLSKAELARRVDLTPPAVLERLRKLEQRGVIRGIAARLDPEALGLSCLAFVQVQTYSHGSDRAAAELARVPGVQEVHHVAGEDGLLVKVRCASARELSHLLRERFLALDAVTSTRSTIVLETVKESSELAIELPAANPGRRSARRAPIA